MLRFGYHLLFWNAYLQEEATQNPQLVRENPPLYGQIIIATQLAPVRINGKDDGGKRPDLHT